MSLESTTFYVARHGESFANIGDYSQENTEFGSPLTEAGIQQAYDLASRLASVDFAAIISSDLNRARQTAEIIANGRNIQVTTFSDLREREKYHHFLASGQDNREFNAQRASDLAALDEEGKRKYQNPVGMESSDEGAQRLLAFLSNQAPYYKGKKVAILTHGNLMKSSLTYLGFATFDQMPDGRGIGNTGYFVLESDGDEFRVTETSEIEIVEGGTRTF